METFELHTPECNASPGMTAGPPDAQRPLTNFARCDLRRHVRRAVRRAAVDAAGKALESRRAIRSLASSKRLHNQVRTGGQSSILDLRGTPPKQCFQHERAIFWVKVSVRCEREIRF